MTNNSNQGTDSQERVELRVSGMHCANCAQSVQRYLESEGLKQVVVDLGENRVRFIASESASLPPIIEGIGKLGYKAELSDPSDTSKSFLLSPITIKFVIAAVFTTPLLLHMVVRIPFLDSGNWQAILSIPVFIVGFIHFGPSAIKSIRRLEPNMDVLILVGFTASLAYSLAGLILKLGEQYLFFETGASIISFVLFGNLLEQLSLKRTSAAVRELQKIQPQIARRITQLSGDEERIEEISYTDIRPGDLLLANTGDRVPADGEVAVGSGSLDESMVTGESRPIEKGPGDQVIGGTVVLKGPIRLKAEKIGKESLLARIIELVESAQAEKPSIQKLGDKVSAIFVPVVLVISLLTLLVSLFILGIEFQEALLRSIAVLVISCPCAMGLATPTAVIVGIGRAAKSGIIMRSGRTLETLAEAPIFVFDKTGVLTNGEFTVRKIEAYGKSEDEIKSIVAAIEQNSSHPIALSLQREFKGAAPKKMSALNEEKGIGMEASDTEGNTYRLGSFRIASSLTDDDSHSLYLIENDTLIASIDLEDKVKDDSLATVSALRRLGRSTALLSGDRAKACREVGEKVGVDQVYSEKLPQEKLEVIRELQESNLVAFVGDGINDAPALALASTGIAVGEGSAVALESADLVILGGKLEPITEALVLSMETLKTIKQNLFWAFFYNVLAIPLAAAGYLNPMIAALAMAFSDVIVIGNSLRLKHRRFAA